RPATGPASPAYVGVQPLCWNEGRGRPPDISALMLNPSIIIFPPALYEVIYHSCNHHLKNLFIHVTSLFKNRYLTLYAAAVARPPQGPDRRAGSQGPLCLRKGPVHEQTG